MPVTYNFSDALALLKDGVKISRIGWNGSWMYLELQTPDENSKMTLPYIYMCIPTGAVSDKWDKQYNRIPWVASHTDILSNDWIVE